MGLIRLFGNSESKSDDGYRIETEEVKQIEVVAAVIHDSEGRVFATQRVHTGTGTSR